MFFKITDFWKKLSIKNRTAVLLFLISLIAIGTISVLQFYSIKQQVPISIICIMGIILIGIIEWLKAYKFSNLSIFLIANITAILILVPFDYIEIIYNFSDINSFLIREIFIESYNHWIFLGIGFILLIFLFDKNFINSSNKILKIILLTFGFIVIIFGSKFSIIMLSTSSLDFLLFLGIAIFTDTFAFFGGKLLGKKIPYKLAPKISKNKTWIGFTFGTIFGFAWIIAISFIIKSGFISNFNENWIYILIFAFIAPIISVLGDLFFSLIKRLVEIKDFSELIPGHGGVFDRIDSHIFIFALSFIFYYFVII